MYMYIEFTKSHSANFEYFTDDVTAHAYWDTPPVTGAM